MGVPTTGWGHIDGITSSMAKVKQAISTAQAAKWFEEDLDIAERAVRKYVKVALNQNQFDALVDFVFNCGASNLASSTLLKLLNRGDYAAVPAQLMRWTKARDRKTGKMVELRGLVIRRKWEADLWSSLAPPEPANYRDGERNCEATVIPDASNASEPVTLGGLIAKFFAALLAAFTRRA